MLPKIRHMQCIEELQFPTFLCQPIREKYPLDTTNQRTDNWSANCWIAVFPPMSDFKTRDLLFQM